MRATKESGFEWLGIVPENWVVSRIGSCAIERRETVSDTDFQPLSVTKKGVVPRLESAAKSDNSEGRKLIREGDFVINSRSDRKGSSGVSAMDGSCSVIYIVLKLLNLAPEYAHHLFRSKPFQEEFYKWGSGIVEDLWSTRYSAMKQIAVPVPPLAEQKAIANFLDRETAKIDKLIAKQEQLITTLDERKQAVIREAVTRGIFGSAQTKESGIPWVGPVCVTWQIAPLKYHAFTGAGSGFPIEEQGLVDEPVPFIKVNSLGRSGSDGLIKNFDDTISIETAKRLGARIFSPKSIVLAKIGAALLLGRIRQLPVESCIDNNMMAVTARSGTSPRFLFYILNLIEFERIVNPGAVPSTSEGAVKNLKFPFPALAEQTAIANYLDDELKKLDFFAQKSREVIHLLRERRQALISAAVTGKLEVGV